MGFFVFASLDAVWVSLSISREFVPRLSIVVTVALATAALLLLGPYFAYVFAFLEPGRVIERIRQQALKTATLPTGDAIALQQPTLEAIEQIADIAINSIANRDRVIATHAVDALKDLTSDYIPKKPRQRPEWFRVGERVVADADFLALDSAALETVSRQRTWVEWKVLRQLQAIFAEALADMRDLTAHVATATRHVGEVALISGDEAVVDLVPKFLNTYLRLTLNARDVRTAYEVLNHYRTLAASLLRVGQGERVLALAERLKYYAHVAYTRDLPFVTETTAYDMAALCEMAFDRKSPVHDRLLAVLLEVDKPAESAAQEDSLRGVRKAQMKLATFYLASGAEHHARSIQRDMAAERRERLCSIRDELLAVKTPEFWEVIDPRSNFDYLEQHRRDCLPQFLGWFPQVAQR